MLSNLRDTLWEFLPAPLKLAAKAGQVALGPFLFVCGFTWDAVMLSRIDALLDNLMLASYLLFLGMFLVLDQRAEQGRLPAIAVRWQWVYRLGVHFFFGGLLSAYVIYYLRSATFGRTALFLGVLALLLVANEFMRGWFKGAGVRLALFLFCTFSFLLFWIPVATGQMGRGVWGLAAIGAFTATAIVRLFMDVSPRSLPGTLTRLRRDVLRAGRSVGVFEAAAPSVDVPAPIEIEDEDVDHGTDPRLRRIERDPVAKLRWLMTPAANWTAAGASWAALLGVLLLLELGGAIPPVPISVMHIGVYHGVQHKNGGAELVWERPPWWRFWRRDDSHWRLRPGDRVCVFAPVFAPGGMHPRLYHRWERWDPDTGSWRWTRDKGTWIQARGGRENGSPHHTCKRHGLRAGPWRVTVETEDRRVVATHQFEMVEGPHGPMELSTREWP